MKIVFKRSASSFPWVGVCERRTTTAADEFRMATKTGSPVGREKAVVASLQVACVVEREPAVEGNILVDDLAVDRQRS